MSYYLVDGMYGFIIGDALGVPVEFTRRAERKEDPVTSMSGYGTHNQPAGTWSDDSSMALATLDSIKEKGCIDLEDIMARFSDWAYCGHYTPFGEVFDVGIATNKALLRFAQGERADKCGGTGERDNGNGSLMRILPVCIYLCERQKEVCTSEDECIYHIHAVSALTHAHIRSQMACGIFYFCVKHIIDGKGSLFNRLQKGMDEAFSYYRRDLSNLAELDNFSRLASLSTFRNTPEDEIKSSGYVVDTLEAAIWCLINTNYYDEAVLKSVNLGDDTDTVGAVTGALAGLYYKLEGIPKDWAAALQNEALLKEIIYKGYDGD